MKLHDCLLVIGELTMEKRYLEDRIEQLEQQLLDEATKRAEENAEVHTA
jgi:hypothetical protein